MLFRSVSQSRYAAESAVSIGLNNADATLIVNNASNSSKGVLFGGMSYGANDTLERTNVAPTPSHDSYASQIRTSSTGNTLVGFSGSLTAADASLKISALRSATALQKYKEIQNSNDPDFANQVLAHFGIKPKVDSRTSVFIGGDDKTLSINPQVNTNFLNGGQPDIKAIGVGDLSAACKFTATTYGMIIGILS